MLIKRSIRLAGHATSIALEPEYWEALEVIARQRSMTVAGLIGSIDAQRTRPLASEIRVFVLSSLR